VRTCYVNVCVAFKVVVMVFFLFLEGCSKYIGGLLQILMVDFGFSEKLLSL
jgi:hypothetical protein